MESQPHILFISSWYPNRNNPTHGIFNQHFAQAAALHHKVSVLHVCSETGLKSKIEQVNEWIGKIYIQYIYTAKISIRLPLLSQWLKTRRMLKAFDLGFEKIQKQRGIPQVIHLNVVFPAGIAVLHLHKKYNIPFVVNEGWTGYMKEDGNYKGVFMKYFTKKVIQAAAMILPVSQDLQAAMIAHGLKGKYKIVPNVVQTNIFDIQSRSSSGFGANQELTFVHVSTFDPPQKNVVGILRAFKKALQYNSDLNLILVGDGEYRPMLEHFVNTNDLQTKVQFKGKMNAEQLANLFNQCRALIMFSNYESFGVVVAEALACGLPVITSRSGGLSNMLNEANGILVEKSNEDQLYEAILNIANGKIIFDKELLRKFVTELYSEPVIAMSLEGLYQEVLSKK